ncbi:MAG: class I SAM-dependent methyltransferase [Flavobacteriia bacterium]|nr:class I SAM-dependent methyltransferase [Flavobacteriia bacterium]
MASALHLQDDVFGQALWDHHQTPTDQNLITWTSLTEEDHLPIGYFFRSFEQMPPLEQKALALARGKVLDIGCGAGSHALYLQNEKKLEVVGLDSAPGAIKTAAARGLYHTQLQSVFDCKDKDYDTLLLLMNGPGICGRLQRLGALLEKLQELLKPGGQVLLDSSDLIYLFDETPEGEKIIPANHYYGELQYSIRYKQQSQTFPWLYVDFDLLAYHAQQKGWKSELIIEGENWDYLARLTKVY